MSRKVIQDIFDYCEEQNENGIFFFIDFEKAFDTVGLTFIFEVLKALNNFGTNFIKWLRLLYNNPKVIVKNNCFISQIPMYDQMYTTMMHISALMFILTLKY